MRYAKIAFYITCFCTIQHDINSNASAIEKVVQVIINLTFLVEVSFHSWHDKTNQLDNKEDKSNDVIEKNINKIIQSDYQLKNLV